MKRFGVYELRTQAGVDYRILGSSLDRNRRSTSKWIGDIVGESKADATKKLQIALRITVNGFIAGKSRL